MALPLAAVVPGVAHEALLAAGLLAGDPLFRFRELEYRWVANADWTFTGSFELAADDALLSPPPPSAPSPAAPPLTTLEVEGVDTVAAIALNGEPLGTTRSAFLRHELPVRASLLRAGANKLTVRFNSSLRYAAAEAAAYPYPVPHTQYHNVWSEPSHRNFVRKPSSDFGWDWGPSFVPTGLVGPLRLTRHRPLSALLEQLTVHQDHRHGAAAGAREAGAVALRVGGWVRVRGDGSSSRRSALLGGLRLLVELCYPDCAAVAAEVRQGGGVLLGLADASDDDDDDASAVSSATASFVLPSAHLWWPRGMGRPHTYELRAWLCARAEGDAGCRARAVSLSRRIGLREVELVQEPAAPPLPGLPNGTSFYFRVNGHAVFAKGANLIPSHVFASAEASPEGEEQWRWLLGRAAAAHMNMVRVWGGGRYQSDAFYSMADELGLMVWQEFIFACALYPRGTGFLRLVTREVRQQVRRLGTHPSILIWGGNNENEAALNWCAETNPVHPTPPSALVLSSIRCTERSRRDERSRLQVRRVAAPSRRVPRRRGRTLPGHCAAGDRGYRR